MSAEVDLECVCRCAGSSPEGATSTPAAAHRAKALYSHSLHSHYSFELNAQTGLEKLCFY